MGTMALGCESNESNNLNDVTNPIPSQKIL
jgi:hypothetical protein